MTRPSLRYRLQSRYYAWKAARAARAAIWARATGPRFPLDDHSHTPH